ncbi:hypothetical protein HYH03_015385 [Edaphochlamys debaryana]|uniref:Uncharacterized protein n=1 Tax=Edaphochlamys debaryana TaxID=47281 RepID=A0A835XLA8_9CHLO|nr:hypothetical protein HYH03_015385 [Edaphochlamys debaryana]|eukprot:KAG2485941.1 hypothetical protein HYH03_015385 [Edaphochlamys debaryana]
MVTQRYPLVTRWYPLVTGAGDSHVGTAGAPRKRKPGQVADDPILRSLQEFARRVNACVARQGRDRVNGRFFGQDVCDEVRRLTLEEQDHLSEDDFVAVLEDAGGQEVVRIGLVEAMSRRTTSARGKKGLETATRMEVDDPAGELVL